MYLKTTYVTDTQKHDDITAMDAKMHLPFLMDMMIETYFKNMTSCQYTLVLLGNLLDNAEMIRLCLVQFNLNDEMNEACEKLEDSPTTVRTYIDFQKFMTKQIILIEDRKGTLATTNIANLVIESTK